MSECKPGERRLSRKDAPDAREIASCEAMWGTRFAESGSPGVLVCERRAGELGASRSYARRVSKP